MKILHYFLGFPPYRTGGLTKYAFDLMQAQSADKHIVSALWPGQMNIALKKIKIKNRINVNGIKNYELINPLPVSLDEGITNFEHYMRSCDPDVYKDFLVKVKPDVIHIHTLMGLHKEFLDITNVLEIRTVFTTHDYFGICPKVTLYRYGVACENDHNCKDCIQCNLSALPLNKIRIMQSPLYRSLKNSIVVSKLRKLHRERFFVKESIPKMPSIDVIEISKKYQKLRAYYIGMLEMVDMVHFNSSVAESVYMKYFTPRSSNVITITHHNIVDNRKSNIWQVGDKIRITLLAPAKPFKGFNVLQSALDELWDSGKQDFELHIFSPVQNSASYMKVQDKGFIYEQLENIFAETDVLVAPSIWYETFGFTVLEAISYGIPVIVSDHVGAKDIVNDGGIIVEAGSVESIKAAVLSLTYEKMQELRNNIQTKCQIKTWKKFIDEIYSVYEG